ncbi:MAG TPA: rhomboid family intramembrane serine protease [Blastocatellia bacterium]|nr:rhomboid family intramembrane serine protease [Blastocatellia bacterium]
MLSILFLILIVIFLAVISSFIPIGNENSTVRRLPWVTFSIMAINVVVYYVTLPVVGSQVEELVKLSTRMEQFVQQHQEILADETVRKQLNEIGLLSKGESESIADRMKKSPELEAEYKEWLRGIDAQNLRDELNSKITAYKEALQESIWYRYGLSPNGNWKAYQLITSAFLHEGLLHLFGNLIFFFAVAFSLEDLWGRGVFLGFYLLGAVCASIPYVVSPIAVPSFGASGAIAATMGAFLFRLPKTRIKLVCIPVFTPMWWLRFLCGFRSLIVTVPGYIFLAAYFIEQVVRWYFDRKAGSTGGVAYSVHIAGFVFGAGFAQLMKYTKYEEKHINPKIEAMVSFSAAPAVNQALEALDKGNAEMAEKKLRAHLSKDPNDTNAMLAAIQVYQQTLNFDRLNSMSARLIRHHLANNDREAALYAYDSLLSAFPDDNVAPRIPAKDWLAICEYLRESDMHREAAVEYERLVNSCPDDPLLGRAAVQGGEAALFVSDVERALKLFKKAEAIRAGEPYGARARMGIEKCNKILELRPKWGGKPAAARTSTGNLSGGVA